MKLMMRILALIMLVGALVGFTAAPSLATDGNIASDTPVCNSDGTWGSVFTWNSTNVPSTVYAEVKAITASAGTMSKAPGQGVMSGNQVILAAFPDHVQNWPGVKTHKGNWSDKFSVVNIPNNVNSITVMVQYDYSNGHSGDPTKTIYKPSNCKSTQPPDDTDIRQISDEPNCEALTVTTHTQKRTRSYVWQNNQWVPRMWSDWSTVSSSTREATLAECPPPGEPEADVETRTVINSPDCVNKTVTTLKQKRTRSYVLQGRTWVAGSWSDWSTIDTSTRTATAAECPPPPPVTDHGEEPESRIIKTGGTCKAMQVVLTFQTRSRSWTSVDGVRTYTNWTAWKTTNKVYPRSPVLKNCVKKVVPRITVIDNCRCKDDHVGVSARDGAIAFKSVHQNKHVFTIRLTAKPGFLLPKDFKHPGKGWAHSVKYVVHTTNTPCPCPPGKKCSAKPKPRPVLPPCVRICR